MKYIFKKIDIKILEYYLLCSALFLYLFRTAIPFLKFPFIFLFSILVLYSIIKYRSILVKSTKDYLYNYFLILLLAAILIIAFLFSNKIYLSVFKDIINLIILLIFYFIITITITSKKNLDNFIQSFVYLVILFAIGISVFRLLDLFNIFSGSSKGTLYQIPYNIEAGELPIDYNFAILPVFFGIIAVLFMLEKSSKPSRYSKICCALILLLFTISIFFAGSRRGLILLFGLLFFLFSIQILTITKYRGFFNQLVHSVRVYFVLFIITSLGCYLFVRTTYKFKNNTLELVGTKNLVATKGEIALTFYRYLSVIDPNVTFLSVYNTIWTPVFDPNDPDSGWGSRMHKTIFPLTGNNVEIVPAEARGYYMDWSSNADTINGNAYSATWISNYVVKESEILEASVYCYLSEDCNLSMAEICSLGSMGNPGTIYDMQKKGTWQKLEFSVPCVNGSAGVLLFISKEGAVDFSSLKGYVIYAYPQVNIIEKIDSIQQKPEILKLNFNTKHIPDKEIKAKAKPQKVIYAGFSINSLQELAIIDKFVDNDPLRRWVSTFISEDTTYTSYNQDLTVQLNQNSFIGARTMRWQFAWQIFKKEYSVKQKILGGGFGFYNWYGFYFLHNKKLSDYPHNPLISVLLYSGVLGLILYIILLYKVVYYYLKYRKEYFLFIIYFILTFFFSFFSAGTPFDPPVMGFFLIFPFFIHHIYRKENSIKNINTDE